jgi:hypothetical protein
MLELRPEDLKFLLNEDPPTAANVISLLQGKVFLQYLKTKLC